MQSLLHFEYDKYDSFSDSASSSFLLIQVKHEYSIYQIMPSELHMPINLPQSDVSGLISMSYTDSPFTHMSAETKSGSITLVSPNGRTQGVNVIVYQTTLEHFAVLYPQKKICRPLGVINLKNTKIERVRDNKSSCGFRVCQQGFDANLTLTFLCDPRDLDSWMDAFKCKINTTLKHQSSLPCVEEDEEV